MTATLWPLMRKVALISPSGATTPDAYEQCLRRMKTLGIKAVTSPHLNHRHRYLAGRAEERLQDLYWAFEQPDIDAVWCLRGGYGAAQLIEHIEWSRLTRARSIPLVGYSDVTALLVAFDAHDLKAIHGSTATELNRLTLADPDVTSTTRWQSLASIGRAVSREAGQFAVENGPEQVIEGKLTGGNLTVLASLCGTPAALKLKESTILLLEDVKEAFYALERSFLQLLQSVDTTQIKAICLGEFTDCKGPRDTPELLPIFREWATPLGIPVFAGLAMGHDGNNQAFALGAEAQLSSTEMKWKSTQ
ncbi:S66 peptidase family protein [Carnimonas nigrificans]|uniref:S66 peptidase family protein n=1 Tax=Carnimonas nigrificans TaxID=64323 RepID=UPI0004711D43|nr:LD-carboxypeptidase [Carnimonas nigrificans]